MFSQTIGHSIDVPPSSTKVCGSRFLSNSVGIIRQKFIYISEVFTVWWPAPQLWQHEIICTPEFGPHSALVGASEALSKDLSPDRSFVCRAAPESPVQIVGRWIIGAALVAAYVAIVIAFSLRLSGDLRWLSTSSEDAHVGAVLPLACRIEPLA
jgi:hypothetical protein